MQIVRVFNNNVVQARDAKNNEIVVMGRGLGFQKKPGHEVDKSLIEKVFVSEDNNSSFSEIYRDLSPEEVELVLEIIKLAEDTTASEFQSNIYITLADHLHFAIERYHQGIPLTNPLAWEIKRLYRTEYNIGKQALELINNKLGIQMSEEEAASIALHIVNAKKEGSIIEETMKMVKMVQDILNIVSYHFNIQFDEESISYNRFVIHLQYFATRVIDKIQQTSDDSFLYEQVQKSYPEAFKCAEKIKVYVENTYDFPVSPDETVYLAIHIQRVAHKI